MQSILLASGSPQRRAIMEQLGLPFRVVVTNVEELETGEPAAVALENSRRKAKAGAEHAQDGELVVGVDTLVALGDAIYGKPENVADAERMLRALAGHTHIVYGGLTAIEGEHVRSLVATTEVQFRELDESLLERYLGSQEWEGRAGGYAIQGLGAGFVREIHGDYLNVVGFPVAAFLDWRLPALR
jgi:septum formation protein